MWGVICEKCEKGANPTHIVLRCRNHPEKVWHTKNIPGRSVFYNLYDDPKMGPECPCPRSDLYHDCPEK
jgi:hypothetical protein